MTLVIPELSIPEKYRVQPATLEDIPAAVALFNTCSQELLGVNLFDEHETGLDWKTPGRNLERDSRTVWTESGRLIGFIEVLNDSQLPIHPWVWGRVHPDYRDQGIGTFLMTWAESRARAGAEQVPPEGRVSMRGGANSKDRRAKELLEGQGMTLIRHSYQMMIEMDSAPAKPDWPEGILVRTLDVERDALNVYRTMVESFRDHFGFVEEPEEEGFARWSHWTLAGNKEFDPTLSFLAMDGDQIVGISLCRARTVDDPDSGYVDTLGVLRPWRRKGLGLALLQHTFHEFWRRGQRGIALGVDASNLTGATRLYERAGMHVFRQFDMYEKELRPGIELSTESV